MGLRVGIVYVLGERYDGTPWESFCVWTDEIDER